MEYLHGIEIKEADEKKGTFEGLAAVYDNVDLGGDVIEPGAFRKSLRKRKHVPLLDGHFRGRIGSAALRDSKEGLRAQGIINMEQEHGRDVFSDIVFGLKHPPPMGLSIGYQTIVADRDLKLDARRLKEAQVHEVSTTPIPMNPEALIESAKELLSQNREFATGGIVKSPMLEGKPEGGKGWDETDTSFRYRVRDPDGFVRLRTITITKGVKSLVGPLKSDSDGGSKVQTVIFSKDVFKKLGQAKKWLADHESITKEWVPDLVSALDRILELNALFEYPLISDSLAYEAKMALVTLQGEGGGLEQTLELIRKSKQ